MSRVLLIEDDADIALGIRTLLTRSGFDVVTVDASELAKAEGAVTCGCLLVDS